MANKYWLETYGKRNKSFIEGVIAGVETFAIWKNGERLVGCMERPLKEVIAEIREQLGGEK